MIIFPVFLQKLKCRFSMEKSKVCTFWASLYKVVQSLYHTKLFIYNGLTPVGTKVQLFSNSFLERNLKNVLKSDLNCIFFIFFIYKEYKKLYFCTFSRKPFIYNKLACTKFGTTWYKGTTC